MTESLFLTESEYKLLKSYPILKAFHTRRTILDYEDSPEKTKNRISMMKLSHSGFSNLQNQLGAGGISIIKIITAINFKKMTRQDCEELAYALGPNLISELIIDTLINSRQELVRLVLGLSQLRHILFGQESNQFEEFNL